MVRPSVASVSTVGIGGAFGITTLTIVLVRFG